MSERDLRVLRMHAHRDEFADAKYTIVVLESSRLVGLEKPAEDFFAIQHVEYDILIVRVPLHRRRNAFERVESSDRTLFSDVPYDDAIVDARRANDLIVAGTRRYRRDQLGMIA